MGTLSETVRVEGASPDAVAPGASFGRFETQRVLGRGAMGVVMAAYDPTLDRQVAIKVLAPTGDADAQARLLQGEAQAMAKLAHPNVVAIHEVGRAGDQLFIAMELVDGITLDAWLAQPRSWRAIVAMFVAAGRGLEAAHAAGVVHRDFKPANVLVGRDGRPRVGDFGLAIPARAMESSPGGTPIYMAPEQWSGGEVDERSDQFAFCVALWRSVWNEPPFPAENLATLRAAVLAGERRSPPRRSPRWLAPLLMRGLELDPAARWPSLGALLDELAGRLARRRRTTWLAAGAGAIVAASAAVVIMTATRAGSPCAAPTERAAHVWNPARRAAIELHARSVDPALGAKRFAAAAAMLDGTVETWSAMNVDACRATRVDGRQSDSLLDLRMRCLDDWLARLDGAVGGLESARDPLALVRAVEAVSNVGELERCANTALLQAVAPPPVEPDKAAAVRVLDAQIAGLEPVLRTRGPALIPDADRLVRRAREIGYPASLATALLMRARIAETAQDVTGEVAILRELVEVAARAHDDETTARAWATLVRMVGLYQGRIDEAKALVPAARAASARVGDPPLLLATVLTNESEALLAAGDATHALENLERARSLLVTAGADRPGSPQAWRFGSLLQSLGRAYWVAERRADAETAYRQAIAVYDRTWGPDTPETGGAYVALGQLLQETDKLDAAEAAIRESIRIRQGFGGDSAAVATSLVTLADVIGRRGDATGAVATAERAAAMARATMRDDQATLTTSLPTLADQYTLVNRYADALAVYDEVFAIAEREHIVTVNVSAWLINRADLERLTGHCDAALPHYRRGAELGAQLAGATSGYVAAARNGEGACLATLGRTAEAIAAFEASVAHEVPAAFGIDVAKTRAKIAQLRGR